MTGKVLTFWHSGGDVFWRADGASMCITHLAEGLRDLYRDEASAAADAKFYRAASRALNLEVQLSDAIDAREQWIRAATGTYRRAA